MRSPELSSVLDELQPAVMTLRCRGYIFFGSSVQVRVRVRVRVRVWDRVSSQP